MPLSIKEKIAFDLLQKLISTDTTNPPGNEYRGAKIVKDFFRAQKIRYQTLEKEKGRTNILGFIGQGRPHLFIACHLDTVPAGDGWKTNPHKAILKNGRVYGRGAVDDKGPLAGVLLATTELKKNEKQLKGTLILGALADEERGNGLGIEYLIENKKLPPIDFAISPDTGGQMREITIAEKGALFFRITTFGKQGHGSLPQSGINAIDAMAMLLIQLKQITLKQLPHPLLSPATINIGKISGGEAPNMIPAKCNVEVDIRFLPSQTPQGIVKELNANLKKVYLDKKPIKFKIEIIKQFTPTKTDPKNLIVTAIQFATHKILNKTAKPIGMSGMTIAKSLRDAGIPTIGFSCGDMRQCHVANENIALKEIVKFAEVLEIGVKEIFNINEVKTSKPSAEAG